jgi:hypothetical protein
MRFRYVTCLSLAALVAFTMCGSAETPAAGAETTHTQESEKPFDLNEIKIEMAESRLRLRHNSRTVSDLVTALEGYLNSWCMPKLLQTLSYPGNPTDPNCITRTARILELNPGNPVGVCVRDGIAAKSCVEAYHNQTVEVFYSGSSREGVDPALRAGLSATDSEKVTKLEEILNDLNRKYQESTTEEDKRAFIKDATLLYEQVLSVACKISSVSFEPDTDAPETSEPSEVAQARERLLQIPPAIRGDYQREMLDKAQKEFTSSDTSKERKEVLGLLLKVIEDPTVALPRKAPAMKRSRMVLSKCFDLIKQASKAVPDLPHTTCHREGWHTPQCVTAIKKWRILKQQEENTVRVKPGPKPTPQSVITHF